MPVAELNILPVLFYDRFIKPYEKPVMPILQMSKLRLEK